MISILKSDYSYSICDNLNRVRVKYLDKNKEQVTKEVTSKGLKKLIDNKFNIVAVNYLDKDYIDFEIDGYPVYDKMDNIKDYYTEIKVI